MFLKGSQTRRGKSQTKGENLGITFFEIEKEFLEERYNFFFRLNRDFIKIFKISKMCSL